MPNGAAHQTIGVAAGGIAAYQYSKSQPDALLEIIGGLAGGYVGAKLPDRVDPPTSPNHRGVGHAMAPITYVASILKPLIPKCQEWCRSEAVKYESLGKEASDPLRRMLYTFLAMVLRFIAGFVVGVPAGYLSHVAMDATTVRGLPVLFQGC